MSNGCTDTIALRVSSTGGTDFLTLHGFMIEMGNIQSDLREMKASPRFRSLSEKYLPAARSRSMEETKSQGISRARRKRNHMPRPND